MPKKTTDIKTELVPVRLPEPMIEGIDLAIKIGQGSSRSDIIKTAIATYLNNLSVTSEMKKRKL